MAHKDSEKTQDIREKYAAQLSAGTYTWKKVKEFVITAGGIVGGWFAGKGFEKIRGKATSPFVIPLGKDAVGQPKGIKGSAATIIGALVGSSIASMIIAYEHWRKMESNKLSIDEINNDVANMKIRQRTDPELLKENDRLREMLETENKNTETLAKRSAAHNHKKRKHAEKIGVPEASFSEQVETASSPERSL